MAQLRGQLGRLPFLTLGIAVVWLVIYLFVQPSFGERGHYAFRFRYAAIPCEITQGRPLRLYEVQRVGNATKAPCGGLPNSAIILPSKRVYLGLIYSMFLHSSSGHILTNIFGLLVYGIASERGLGRLSFVSLLVAGGLLGNLMQILAVPDSTLPILGGSGAIYALMGTALLLFPSSRVFGVLVIGRLTLAVLILEIFLFLLQGELVWPHIGGLLTGLIFGLAFARRAGSPVLATRRSEGPADGATTED